MGDEFAKDLKIRTEQLFATEETMDQICKNIVSGGSLIDWCKVRNVRYADFWSWINKDKDRKQLYQDALVGRGEWYIESTIRELRFIGFSDLRDIYDDDGKLLPVKQWPEEVAKTIASLEQVEEFEGKGSEKEVVGYLKKVKAWDKLKALELIGKNLGMFIERHSINEKLTLEDLVESSRGDGNEANSSVSADKAT